MDARRIFVGWILFLSCCSTVSAQLLVGPRHIVQTPNFTVYARSAALANEVAKAAEENRKKLALHWLGSEIPNWPRPCPLNVQDGPIAANGETKYVLIPGGGVADFQMRVSGTPERILDSVLPHEITHTILASHFAVLGKPIPRWADEGACTTVEHVSERSKHDHMLIRFLGQGKGIPFRDLFQLTEYPADILPLYAHGYSLTCFLIAQGGPRHFIHFLERGLETDDWVGAIEQHYGYPLLGKLQVAWEAWVNGGGGEVAQYTADARGVSRRAIAANTRTDAAVSLAAVSRPLGESTPPVSTQQSQPSIPRINSPGNDEPASLALAAKVSDRNRSPNSPDSGSYYLNRFRQYQASSPQAQEQIQPSGVFVPATPHTQFDPRATPYTVSQPAPFQTMGGGSVQR